MLRGKKILSLFMTMVIVSISASFSVFANDSTIDSLVLADIEGTSTYHFNEDEFVGMTDFEKGLAKLESNSLSPDTLISSLTQESIEKIGRSEFVTTQEIFLMEKDQEGLASNSENARFTAKLPIDIPPNMVEVSEAEYNFSLSRSFDEQKFVEIESSEVTIAPFDSNNGSYSSDRGQVRLYINSYHYSPTGLAKDYSYQVVGEFIWDSMPYHRATDIFGISRADNTTFLKNTFQGQYLYDKVIYGGMANASGWYGTYVSHTTPSVNCSNDDSNNYSMSIRISVPKDDIPLMLEGRYYTATYPQYLRGYVAYEGVPAQMSIGIVSFNHWLKYAHQTSGTLSMNPSVGVSYPWGISFSISPSWFSNFSEHTLMITDRLTIS